MTSRITPPGKRGPGTITALAVAACLGAALLALPAEAPAQNIPLPPPDQAQQMLQQAVQQNPGLAEVIRQKIQNSGMTPDQIRARLAAGGYPPDLLDAYMSGGGGAGGAAVGAQEVSAVQALGLGAIATPRQPTLAVDTGTVRTQGEGVRPESLTAGNFVFGVDVFRRGTTEFLPVLSGPVPPDYKLGPGDQLVLILTGDVELAHVLSVTRQGFVLIPQVGQVFVANLTVDQLRDVLYTRLGRVYSGVRRGSEAKIRFDLSVANVRVNQVYVVGEVRQPGAYQISALGTALTALYAAGGITARSNMRRIEVRRLDQIVATLDLYDYLLKGIKHDDIRLQTGDVVYVPLRGKRAQITGAIVRPAIYELGEAESLPDLLRAAGGFRADAALARLSVHRIVPIPERGSGPFPRTVVDVQLPTVVSVAGDDPPPAPHAPGRFGNVWVPGIGVEDGDSVVVDAIAPLDSSFFVAIAGAVNKPGRYPWRDGMTLRELVVAARGPKVGASLKEAEIARLPEDRSTGRLAETVRVPLDSTYLLGRDSAGRYVGPPGTAFPAKGAPEVPLRPYDNVLLLRQPEFELQRTVTLVGQVRFPGTYALTARDERLADLIDRAGGLTPVAYPDGVRFIRMAGFVGRLNVDVPRALQERNSRFNIILQTGDSITIPEFQPSVRVSGAVNTPGSVLWVRGADLNYYLGAAGGLSYRADKGRVSVRAANGEVSTRHRTLLIFGSDPTPGPGSEVMVPTKDSTARGTDAIAILGVVAQIIAATVTLVVVARR
jgi:protein involved in polysaccharide export with SLBB domain